MKRKIHDALYAIDMLRYYGGPEFSSKEVCYWMVELEGILKNFVIDTDDIIADVDEIITQMKKLRDGELGVNEVSIEKHAKDLRESLFISP